jgi:sortase (surface protein transpeptidase)
VFSAHVDYFPNIRGPFYNLHLLDAGDEVVVVMDNGTEYLYRLIRKVRYPEETIPMGDLIRPPDKPAGSEWVTLITCGGRFQPYQGGNGAGQYLDRDVVVAERVQ